MTPTGAEQIQAERHRQLLDEHFDAAHDDWHADSELVLAATAYAVEGVPDHTVIETPDGLVIEKVVSNIPPTWWPWDKSWWKPSDDPIPNLVKAGALIAAEIDRLQRAER